MRNFIGDIRGKHIVLLQGPHGPFFKHLDRFFRTYGACTQRISLNAGDEFFSYKDNLIRFKDKPHEWESFIRGFFLDKNIDIVFVFGDCRSYQKTAIEVARELGVEVFVFEEGYIRPDYITMEKKGVNNNSLLPRSREFYEKLEKDHFPLHPPAPAGIAFSRMALQGMIYYFMLRVFRFRYPYYQHHRHAGCIKEAFYGIRNGIRKLCYRFREYRIPDRLQNDLKECYYFVPLQTHKDFQLQTHSDYRKIEEFVTQVLTSFAQYAPKNTFLMFKHHPMDRGRKNYSRFIYETAADLKIRNRVMAFHDVHLPTCLKNAIGTITINSTVGLSSIYHQKPTLTLGKALYDIEGLTCQGMSLDQFWTEYRPPRRSLFLKYRNYIIANSQLNGNFYGLFPVDLEERIFITPGRRESSADNEENEDVPHGRLIGFHSSGTGTTMPG
jgi:capsular polysaccharide export protein